MFMNWKIPSRIADEPPSSRHGIEQIQPKLGINRRVPGAAHLKCGDLLPQIAGKETTLTQKRKQSQPESVSPSFLRKNDTNDTNGIIRQSKSFRTQQLLKTFKGPATFTTLDSFLKTATDREKDILEKTMKLIYTKDASSFDAIKNMENWLSKASAEDRNVAASFFETIGVQMMAHSSAQERETVTKILSLLKNYQRNDEQYLHRSKTVGNIKTSPKYVRLLTPSTRANKWLHQTWHHLPSYQDDNPVFNKSAVYTEPGKVPFRHWNIHPDWQLQSEFY